MLYDVDSDFHKVHADATKYTSGSTKQEVYEQLLEQAEALFAGQRNWVLITINPIFIYKYTE